MHDIVRLYVIHIHILCLLSFPFGMPFCLSPLRHSVFESVTQSKGNQGIFASSRVSVPLCVCAGSRSPLSSGTLSFPLSHIMSRNMTQMTRHANNRSGGGSLTCCLPHSIILSHSHRHCSFLPLTLLSFHHHSFNSLSSLSLAKLTLPSLPHDLKLNSCCTR